MEISPILLTKMLIVAFLFGIQSGIFFDFGRSLRLCLFGDIKSQKNKKIRNLKLPFSKRELYKKQNKITQIFENIFVFICDFLWVVYSFLGLMKINYSYNDGGIRAFTFFSLILGFILYYFTVSKLVIFIMELLSISLRFVIFSFFDAISIPFLKIYNNLVKKLKKRCEKMRLDIEKKRKKVYNVSELVCENITKENKRNKIKVSVLKNQKKEHGKNEEK